MFNNRRYSNNDDSTPPNRPIASLRPSKLVWSAGPGAITDLQRFTVVTMGIQEWAHGNQMREIKEERLLIEARRVVGSHVNRLMTPTPASTSYAEGVPVRLFPEWFRCPVCGRLDRFDNRDVFKFHYVPYAPEQSYVYHVKHDKKTARPALPVRFVVACPDGHLDDFPWHEFVHGGETTCNGALIYKHSGDGEKLEDVYIYCSTCKAHRNMKEALYNPSWSIPCRGRHPHLDSYSKCGRQAKLILIGASNLWFPITIDMIALPTNADTAKRAVLALQDLDLIESSKLGFEKFKFKLEALYDFIKDQTLKELPAIDVYNAARSLYEERSNAPQDGAVRPQEHKRPEWRVLVEGPKKAEEDEYVAEYGDGEFVRFKEKLKTPLLVTRLRQVVALMGFTRLDAQNELLDEATNQTAKRVPLSPYKEKINWLPARETFGEGVFVQFDEGKIAEWESRPEVQKRGQELCDAHVSYLKLHSERHGENFDEDAARSSFPGARFVMLHTVAHLLIREFSLHCGYGDASLRERVYANLPGETGQEPMAGILLYTASSDSDGALGGLVEEGRPENFELLLRSALQRAQICSSDPFCSKHMGDRDGTTHGAACHACAFASETSCETYNRYLDRALVVDAFDVRGAAFFSAEEYL